MCRIISLSDKIINEENLCWGIEIAPDYSELFSISRNENSNIVITILTYSFERIEFLREKALCELKQLLLKSSGAFHVTVKISDYCNRQSKK